MEIQFFDKAEFPWDFFDSFYFDAGNSFKFEEKIQTIK